MGLKCLSINLVHLNIISTIRGIVRDTLIIKMRWESPKIVSQRHFKQTYLTGNFILLNVNENRRIKRIKNEFKYLVYWNGSRIWYVTALTILNKDIIQTKELGSSLILLEISLMSFFSHLGGCPRGVMVKAMDCRNVVSEFKLQSCYYIHFRTNTLGKGMNPLIPLWFK